MARSQVDLNQFTYLAKDVDMAVQGAEELPLGAHTANDVGHSGLASAITGFATRLRSDRADTVDTARDIGRRLRASRATYEEAERAVTGAAGTVEAQINGSGM